MSVLRCLSRGRGKQFCPLALESRTGHSVLPPGTLQGARGDPGILPSFSYWCTGLTTPVLNFIGSEGGTVVMFVCCSCQVTSANPFTNSSTDASNASVSQCLPQLFNIIKSLADTVANLTTQVQLSISSQSVRVLDTVMFLLPLMFLLYLMLLLPLPLLLSFVNNFSPR